MWSGKQRSLENRYPLSQDCPLTAGESLRVCVSTCEIVFVPHVTVVRQRNKDLCLSKLKNLLVLARWRCVYDSVQRCLKEQLNIWGKYGYSV